MVEELYGVISGLLQIVYGPLSITFFSVIQCLFSAGIAKARMIETIFLVLEDQEEKGQLLVPEIGLLVIGIGQPA